MATFSTEGIILKRSNFSEADRILTVLTPFKGKVKILAKGVRRITSRRGGNVEALNKVKLHLFEGKEFYLLTEAESIKIFAKIKSNLIVSSYATHVCELVDRLLPENEVSPQVYKLLEEILVLLENNPRLIFVRAFEIKLLSLLGFWSDTQVQTTSLLIEILHLLRTKKWLEIDSLQITPDAAGELERILRMYLEKVLESPLRSMKVIKSLQK